MVGKVGASSAKMWAFACDFSPIREQRKTLARNNNSLQALEESAYLKVWSVLCAAGSPASYMGSIHFPMEELILLLARRADTTRRTAYQKDCRHRNNDLWQVRAQAGEVSDQVVYV